MSSRQSELPTRTIPTPPAGKIGWPWQYDGAPADRRSGHLPRVSIVIPSFNQGRFIEATLRSIILQDYPNLELIVMDGGSRDETVEILRRYDAWIDHWVSEKDRGQTHAINKGLEISTGEIFTYLNSDDLLHPEAIWTIVDSFAEHPDAAVIHGECLYVDEAGVERFRQQGEVSDLASYLRIWERFGTGNYITQPEAFLRLSALRDVGPFREELHSVMDFEMWLRLLAAGHRFVSIPHPIAHFRTYPLQKSSVDPGYELFRVIESYVPKIPKEAGESVGAGILADIPKARAELLVRAGIAANVFGSYRNAVRYCLAAVRHDPGVLASYPFWSTLAQPLKKVVPRAGRGRLRVLLQRGS